MEGERGGEGDVDGGQQVEEAAQRGQKEARARHRHCWGLVAAGRAAKLGRKIVAQRHSC